MAGVADLTAVKRFVFSRLSVDAAVGALIGEDDEARLYPDRAPQFEGDESESVREEPFVVYSQHTGQVFWVAGGRQRGYSEVALAIWATAPGEDYEPAQAVLQAIDASLTAESARGNVAVGGVNHWIESVGCQQDLQMAETVRGREWRSLGGVYLFQVHGS